MITYKVNSTLKGLQEFFKLHSGYSIAEAIDHIKKTIVIDRHENTYNNSMEAHGVRLFYTANDNYKQGAKNDGGKGWYLSMNAINGRKEYKIKQSL